MAACGDTTAGSGPGNVHLPAGDASVDAKAAVTCTSNGACIDAMGGPALCVAGLCVAVDTKVCSPNVLPNVDALRSENVVVVGGFVVPLQETPGFVRPSSLGYELALKELDQAGGIPGSPRRNVAMIVCEPLPPNVWRSIDHVTRELRLPAIVGNFVSYVEDDRLRVSQRAVNENVFTVNLSASPELKFAPDTKELVWNLTGTEEDVALAYRPLMQRVETYVANRPDRPAGPIKVAVLSQGGPISTVLRYGPIVSIASGIHTRDASKALVFNGKSVQENGDNYKEIDPGGYKLDPVGSAISALLAYRPDVIIALLGDVIDNIAAGYESALGASPPPVWLFGPRSARLIVPYLANASQGGFAAKKPRFLGIDVAGLTDASERTAWLARMAAAYPNVPQATYVSRDVFYGADASYDAVYWLAYGLAAAGPGAPVSGPSFATGVRKLLAGPKIHPGSPDVIAGAFSQVSVGNASFEGALGPPDVDARYGTWNTVGAVYCFEESAAGVAPRYDVLRFNRSTGALDGTFDCFAGF